MSFHVRAHAMGNRPRVRIWTEDMVAYGQFNIANYSDIEALHQLISKIGVGKIVVHHCDGIDECQCSAIEYGQDLAERL